MNLWVVGSWVLTTLCATLRPAWGQESPKRIVVGSKLHTETQILGEITAQLIEAHTDLQVERKLGLGGTLVCFEALKKGELDVYASYTGTAWSVVLRKKARATDPLKTFLLVQAAYRERFGLRWMSPFGLNNTYALVMQKNKARALGIKTLTDLAARGRDFRVGVSVEFLNRGDGYPGLQDSYGMSFTQIRGVEHGLAYEALHQGALDVVDAYSTDGKLKKYDLAILEDDRDFFPPYHAANVVREETLARYPELERVLGRLRFRITDTKAQNLNFLVESGEDTFASAARKFLQGEGLLVKEDQTREESEHQSRVNDVPLFQLLRQHLELTLVSVFLAVLIAVPLGVWASRSLPVQRLSLSLAGVIQTIPSLALLAFMIPLPGLGLGVTSAVVALVLYALLPILRNTYTGIAQVDPTLIETARGLGLNNQQILFRIELPLAAPMIMAGIRTSTVIGIGVATLAAFIGAGGLGQPIVTGLLLNDAELILAGALPAAALALVADFLIGRVERRLAPGGVL